VIFDPRQLFLVDAVGAVVTAVLLAAVVAQLEQAFGMPSGVVYVLSAIAAGFAVYSFTCHLTRPGNWRRFLRIIAIANLSYCVLTLILIFVYRFEVTALGVAYFVGEIVIVGALAIYELITVRRGADR
jgi:hypothetical protein